MMFQRFTLRKYRAHHENFISKVKALSHEQHTKLLSEYPAAMEIKIYHDKKKWIKGSEAIYVTDNFLFVPGLFLVSRHDIEDIFITSPQRRKYWQSSFTFLLKDQSRQFIDVIYDFRICPETAEQVMAWFWQLDPNTPEIPEKVKSWYTKNTGLKHW